MAESFISSIAAKVLGKLATLAYNEFSLAWNAKRDLQKLERTLSTLKAVLLDAEERQAHNHELSDWLQKLKDVCYDVEDVLDGLEVESLRKQVVNQGSVKRKVIHFCSSSNPLAFNFKLGHKIKKIRERLDEIAAEKDQFHLNQKVDNRRVVQRETHSFVVATDVIGRDEDREAVIQLLMHPGDSGNLSVIPIVGIGGLGKTTLAKLVYNDERVDGRFELKMWVCVSDDFDVKQLIVKIIKSATGQDLSNLDLDQLQRGLQDALCDRRYLLVLDDVWNDDAKKWSELNALLLGGANGSKIIVTTRSNRVASIMGTTPHYNLESLPQESCLSLFIACAFRQGQEKQHPNLVKIGEEIVKKCGGVPLAIKTLGSLLYSVIDECEWALIRDNEIWELEGKENDVLAVLKLSYDHLPPHLKQCFAYCSLFPKDYTFNSLEVIQFWMPHGLLQSPHENEELEDIGLRYLKELWSRSFFQDINQFGQVVFFKMHDIIHDLATLVAKGECAIVHLSGQKILKNIRHLSILDFKLLGPDIEGVVGNLNSIRTISCPVQEMGPMSESFLNTCLSQFKCLRMLMLRNSTFEVLPDSIGAVKPLRYLDLTLNKRIKKLPNSICKLQSLQTLMLGVCMELEELPRDMKYMISLRYLIITTKQKRLPDNGIGCLKSLRYLSIQCCENLEYLFEGVQHLTALRTLGIFNCPNLISLPRGMKCLTALENLVIRACEKLNLRIELEREDSHQDHLSGFSLRFLWIQGLPELVELPQWLLQGSLNTLQHLYVENSENLKALPELLPNLASLVRLVIRNCPSLISLPRGMIHLTALEILVIAGCEKLNLTIEDNDQDPFSGFKLQDLWIKGLPELVALPQWLLCGSTNSLQVMGIEDCPNLTVLPELLQNLTSLQRLYIVNDPQLTFLPEGMHRLTCLRKLLISGCPALSERCKPRSGDDWPKIAHVPEIYLDGDKIKSTDN